MQQWNFNVQKKIPGNVLIDAGYVGTKSTRLIVTFEDLDRPIQLVDPRTPGLASLNARRPNQDYQRAVRRTSRSATPYTTRCSSRLSGACRAG